MKNRPKLISEISCNHNNSLDLTKELIDKNLEAGTDFIKLQLYSPQTITGNFNHKIKGTIWKNLDLYKLYKKTHMKKKRLIPVLLLKNGWIVQSNKFSNYKFLGNPTTSVKRLSEWCSDELIYLDISKDAKYDIKRDDQNYPNRNSFLEIINDVSKMAFMPLCVGGNIKTIKENIIGLLSVFLSLASNLM